MAGETGAPIGANLYTHPQRRIQTLSTPLDPHTKTARHLRNRI